MSKTTQHSCTFLLFATISILSGCNAEENLLDSYAGKSSETVEEESEPKLEKNPGDQAKHTGEPTVKTAFPNPPISDQAFREAARLGDGKVVARAIERGINVNSANANGQTALMLAAFEGHTEVVRLLTKSKAQVNRRDAMNRTALTYSASGKNPETVAALLEASAEIDVVDNGEGWTPLMFASAEGNLEVIKLLLLHGADPHLADRDGETSLQFAANNGHLAAIELLKAEIGARKKP